MLGSVFGKALWDWRRAILAWTIGITAVGVGYAAFFPAINTPEYRAALDAFPKGVLDALGFADIATAAGYLGSTTFGLLGPALIVIFAAAMGGAAIAGDEEAGRLDLILAHPESRWRVLVQRFAAIVVAMIVVCLVLAAVLIAIAGPAQLTDVGPANMLAAAFHLAMLGSLFAALAVATGAATGRRAVVFGLVAIVGVVGYFANTLGPSIEGIAWVEAFSPFHYYADGVPLRNGIQGVDLGVLAIAAVALVTAGGFIFDRRDIAV